MAHIYTAGIHWSLDGADFAANRYSRGHTWTFDGGVEVPASSSPSIVPLPHSVEAAVDPEEAFVASLSSCHMLWFLDIARQAGHVVTAYDDAADGEMKRNGEGRMAITSVTLRPRAAFEGDAPDMAALTALHHKAHEACFIANSVKTEIWIEPRTS
ncbi:MAG: OsmC family protein [Rhodobiaceae bacterium]|nr:OsmC family protein [Rhodobiaceae bacterium]MCC0048955.1 OsmC family protein [Rhodobiaceae bacterium]